MKKTRILRLNKELWMEVKFSNKAFKSDSQRLAFSLRSSIAKRRSHLNAALAVTKLAILKVIE